MHLLTVHVCGVQGRVGLLFVTRFVLRPAFLHEYVGILKGVVAKWQRCQRRLATGAPRSAGVGRRWSALREGLSMDGSGVLREDGPREGLETTHFNTLMVKVAAVPTRLCVGGGITLRC